jgi:hypothetical protein
MAGLTRERIAEIRANVASVADGGDEAVHLAPGEWEALLSMASRCVSEGTLRELAAAHVFGDEAFEARHRELYAEAKAANDEAMDAESRFFQMAKKDLKEAAEALAKEGGLGG